MPKTAVTPTRMVLNQLKGRLKTARRGHKLLKDKRDELMRQFMDVVKLNKELRRKVEEGMTGAFASLTVASTIMSPEMLEQALLYPRQSVELGMSFKNIMSVNVPVYSFRTKNNDPSEIYPYGFAQTSGELDDALEKLARVFEDMLELAQVEKTMQLLAEEIEKTRRRVNALEYVMIPNFEESIRYIAMKLEENGMINKAERLFAQVTMDEARRELESARKDLNVAQNALKVLLNVEDAISINPSSPLFMNHDLPDELYFKNLVSTGSYIVSKLRIQEAMLIIN